jgi:hypothetical protein
LVSISKIYAIALFRADTFAKAHYSGHTSI